MVGAWRQVALTPVGLAYLAPDYYSVYPARQRAPAVFGVRRERSTPAEQDAFVAVRVCKA